MKIKASFKTEYRQGSKVIGTIIQEGRAARTRRELFTANSLRWSNDGINILDGHKGQSVGVAMPKRLNDGRIEITIPATDNILEIRRKKPYLSIEFYALDEATTNGGIREIREAFVKAAAFVDDPEYKQATTEVRRRVKWL